MFRNVVPIRPRSRDHTLTPEKNWVLAMGMRPIPKTQILVGFVGMQKWILGFGLRPQNQKPDTVFFGCQSMPVIELFDHGAILPIKFEVFLFHQSSNQV